MPLSAEQKSQASPTITFINQASRVCSIADHGVCFVRQGLPGLRFEKPPTDPPFFRLSLFGLNGEISSPYS